MALTMGLGAQARLTGTPQNPVNRMGLRMPLGIEYILPSVPIGLYAEAVPIFNLGTTDQYFSGDAIVGFHYYWFTASD
jgi:hypothetical protein